MTDRERLLDSEWMAKAEPAQVKALLDRGANLSVQTEYGVTPLHAAAANQNPAVVALLLDYGADVNARDVNGVTPLHTAAENDNSAVLALLLNHGADVNAQTKPADTTIMFGRDDTADTPKTGWTPLHAAASQNLVSRI